MNKKSNEILKELYTLRSERDTLRKSIESSLRKEIYLDQQITDRYNYLSLQIKELEEKRKLLLKKGM